MPCASVTKLCRGYSPLKESGDQSPLSHLAISTASLRICYGPERSEFTLESEIDVGFGMRRKSQEFEGGSQVGPALGMRPAATRPADENFVARIPVRGPSREATGTSWGVVPAELPEVTRGRVSTVTLGGWLTRSTCAWKVACCRAALGH
jgi:hypothetical protein